MTVGEIKESLQKTDSSAWELLSYKYILEKSDEEIAKIIGVDKNSIRQYLTRARRKARKAYEER